MSIGDFTILAAIPVSGPVPGDPKIMEPTLARMAKAILGVRHSHLISTEGTM